MSRSRLIISMQLRVGLAEARDAALRILQRSFPDGSHLDLNRVYPLPQSYVIQTKNF